MTQEEALKDLEKVLRAYQEQVEKEFIARWNAWTKGSATTEVHEVVGALLARQATLVTQFAEAPSNWNGHMAPLVLRAMVDVHITLAWIFKDPVDRARKFIDYGLSQEKLSTEHLKAAVKERGADPDKDPGVRAHEGWINSQRFTFLTEVNVGSWSGIDTRKMAEEAGCLELYRRSYLPYSAAAHSMWNHVAKYNLRQCENPLHRYHRVPNNPAMSFELEYIYGAASYLNKTFKIFDDHAKVSIQVAPAIGVLEKGLTAIRTRIESEAPPQQESRKDEKCGAVSE